MKVELKSRDKLLNFTTETKTNKMSFLLTSPVSYNTNMKTEEVFLGALKSERGNLPRRHTISSINGMIIFLYMLI